MRSVHLLQRLRPSGRRRRPGHFRVKRPDQPWHMDTTSVWVAKHGWPYLNAIVDFRTGGSRPGASIYAVAARRPKR